MFIVFKEWYKQIKKNRGIGLFKACDTEVLNLRLKVGVSVD